MENTLCDENTQSYYEVTRVVLSDNETETISAVDEVTDAKSLSSDSPCVDNEMSVVASQESNNKNGDVIQDTENIKQSGVGESMNLSVQSITNTNENVEVSPGITQEEVNKYFIGQEISPSCSVIMPTSPFNSMHGRSFDFTRTYSFVESFKLLQPMTMFSSRSGTSSAENFSPSPYRSPSPPPCCECCESIFGSKKGPKVMC